MLLSLFALTLMPATGQLQSSSSSSSSASTPPAIPTYYLYPSTLYDFETPSLAFSPLPYLYNPPTSAAQPFTWPTVITTGNGGGGVAELNSPFDALYALPPSGDQYAFIQTSPNSLPGQQVSNMSAPALLSGNQSYYITFFYAARAASTDEAEPGWQTQSTLTVVVNGNTVWSSVPNITDRFGWTLAQTDPFPGLGVGDFVDFVVTSSSNDDHAVLVDSVTISVVPTLVFTQGAPIVPDTLYGFETPVADTVVDFPTYASYLYIYNPGITSNPAQPWQFAVNPLDSNIGLGGIAQMRSPFDPPPPIHPPDNVQVRHRQSLMPHR